MPNSKDLKIALSTPGKVILHGEHSVVYGRIAVAASLGLRTKLLLERIPTEQPEKLLTLDLKALNIKRSFDLADVQSKLLDGDVQCSKNRANFNFQTPDEVDHENVLSVVENFLDSIRPELDQYQALSLTSLFYLFVGVFSSTTIRFDGSVTLTVETELQVSAGSGSSASYLVSLAAAFLRYIQVNAHGSNVSKPGYKPTSVSAKDDFDLADLRVISAWAQNAERIIHGKPSGIDNTVCTFGSLVEFRKGTEPKIVKIEKQFKILLVNTKVPRNTKTLVAKVAELKEKYPDVVESLLDALNAVALRAINILAADEETKDLYSNIGDLIVVNQNILKTLGVSHPSLDDICLRVSKYGLHGKLTGAGGGGYATAVVPPYADANLIQELCSELKNAGYEAVLTDIGGPGVTLHK